MPFIGGALAGAGALAAGLFGANAASNAAQSQVQSTQLAINAQQDANRLAQANLQPFRYAGTGAINNLWGQFNPGGALNQYPQQAAGLGAPPTLNLMGATGPGGLNLTLPTDPSLASSFQQSPGYQYELQQQQNAIQNSAPGKTGALSGNMLMALQQNAQGLASQDYSQFYNWLTQGQLQNYNANTQAQTANYNAGNNNYWNQYNATSNDQSNLFQRLFAIAGMGQNAAAQQGAQGLGAATNIGQAQIGAGQAIAAGQIGGANALAGGIGGFTGSINNALAKLNNSGGSGFNPLSYLFGAGGTNPSGGYSGSPGNYNYYGPGVDPSLSY
jgi:hypothetical protein